jgi:uncharacterized protein DUF1761
MSFDALGDLNWLAVIVAAIAYFVLGALWYAPPVFGKPWQRSIGWEIPADQRPNPAVFLSPAITCVVASIAVGALAVATGTDTIGEGIVLGLFAGIGIAAAVLFVTAIFEPTKPDRMTWFLITAGYHLVGLLIASVILAVWQ